MSLFICFPFPLFGSLAEPPPPISFSLTPSLLSAYPTLITSHLPLPPSFSSPQSEHNMDSFSCVPHCLHHRAAQGLLGSSICLLCACRSPCLSLLVSLSVCGNPRLSKSVFCAFGSVSVCRALCLPTHIQSEVWALVKSKFFGYMLIYSGILTLILHKGHVVVGHHLLKPMAAPSKE